MPEPRGRERGAVASCVTESVIVIQKLSLDAETAKILRPNTQRRLRQQEAVGVNWHRQVSGVNAHHCQ